MDKHCKTCDHIHHKDGGHCYMYREPPAQTCLSHTAHTSPWRALKPGFPLQTRPGLGQLSEKRMDAQAFTQTYNESRNGANFLVRHPLVGRFKFRLKEVLYEPFAKLMCWTRKRRLQFPYAIACRFCPLEILLSDRNA